MVHSRNYHIHVKLENSDIGKLGGYVNIFPFQWNQYAKPTFVTTFVIPYQENYKQGFV